MEKTIYELELHETIVIKKETGNAGMMGVNGKITIATRVAGGWIYNTSRIEKNSTGVGLSESSVFVPYSDEFKPKRADDIPNPND